MLIQLSSHFGGSSAILFPAMRFNARRSLSVSPKVHPELLRLLEVFSCLLNSVLDMVAVETPNSSGVLATEALSIRASTMSFFKLI